MHLSDKQTLLFAEDNAYNLWLKIKKAYTSAEDQIDASNDLKVLHSMKEREFPCEYIARARGLATKCVLLGLEVTSRELVSNYTVRCIKNTTKHSQNTQDTERETT